MRLIKCVRQVNLFTHLSFMCLPFYLIMKNKSYNKYKNLNYDELGDLWKVTT